MRAVLLRSVAVIGLGALVLAGVLYVASTVDSRPPTVTAVGLTQPVPDESAIGLITTGLEIAFSEPVDTASAEAALSIEPDVPGSASWSGSTMLFTPRAPLEPDTSYVVSIQPGVRDLAGNRMSEAPDPFAFETAGPPVVVETDPTDGATGVALEGPISLTFSTPMDTASVEAALRLRPTFDHQLRWSGRQLDIVPAEPLDPDREYVVAVEPEAIDVAGLELTEPLRLAFRTVAPGLLAATLVPADGSDGIAPTSPIAIFFDRPIDPGSASADEALTITPEVAGSISIVDVVGHEPADPEDGSVLLFTPSGPLPPTTTFEVQLGTGVVAVDGGGLAEPVSWSFTTGTSLPTLSNQVVFLSDRSGIPNLWAMNPDGSAPRQLSAELSAVLDYAIAPDSGSFVVGDGRRLVLTDASGANRRILTQEDVVEFDPAYAPNSQRIAFARADAVSGAGLGLWELTLDGGSVTPIDLADDPSSPEPSGSGLDDAGNAALRAPRYAPDGRALAFVDLTGTAGIVDLDTGAVTRVPFGAEAAPSWLLDSAGVLLTGLSAGSEPADPSFPALVRPLEPSRTAETVLLDRGGALADSRFGPGASVAGVAADGRIAIVGRDGRLRIADGPTEVASVVAAVSDERVMGAAFAPGEEAMVVVIGPTVGDDATGGRIERIDLEAGGRLILTNDGWRPRWLP